MKRLILLTGLVVLVVLAGTSASAIPDSNTPIADSSIPEYARNAEALIGTGRG